VKVTHGVQAFRPISNGFSRQTYSWERESCPSFHHRKGCHFLGRALALHDSSIRKLWFINVWAIREMSIEIEGVGGLMNTGAVFSEAS
jgi:hypothetical protein